MSVVSAPPAATVRAARTAVFAAFAINGAAFAAFASRVPDIKHGLGLSAGELGLTLLAASLGSVIGLPLSGWIVHRLGAARTLMGAAIIQSVGLVGVGHRRRRRRQPGGRHGAASCSSASAPASSTWR